MAKIVGGVAQAGHVDRVRGVDPVRCLVVPVDVGKGPHGVLERRRDDRVRLHEKNAA